MIRKKPVQHFDSGVGTGFPSRPGRHRPEQVVVIHRKRWSPSTGNPGRHGPERAVITAPEGIFKGCSTVFQAFEGEWAAAENKQLVAKAMLNPSLSKKQRAKVHDAFLAHLDALGNSGVDLPNAIDELFAAAKEKMFIIDSITKAHELVNGGQFDPSEAAEAVSDLLDGNRRQIEADAQRLSALINEVADRVGEAPVSVNENGEVFVHPHLARELEKPGNEVLSEMLIGGARANARGQD